MASTGGPPEACYQGYNYLLLFDKINTTLININIQNKLCVPSFLNFVKHLFNIIESNELTFMAVLFSMFYGWAFMHCQSQEYFVGVLCKP